MNVILFSGGLDSAVLSARFLANNPDEKVTLFTLVNSRQNTREVSCASALYDKFRKKYGARVQHRMKMIDTLMESPEYTPFRNSLYILSAANYFNADELNIYIGLIHSNNPLSDCNSNWLNKINELVKLENKNVHIHAPFLFYDKEEVYVFGKKYGVSLSDTYSCNYGDKECGKCEDCRARNEFSRW